MFNRYKKILNASLVKYDLIQVLIPKAILQISRNLSKICLILSVFSLSTYLQILINVLCFLNLETSDYCITLAFKRRFGFSDYTDLKAES